MSLSPLPMSLHLLADRKLSPGAALLAFDGEDQDAQLALVGHPDFAALSAGFPCFITAAQADRLSAPLLQALLDAGCQQLADALLHQSSALVKPVLPPGALWLDGDWYLAPPGKPTGSQSASRTLALKLVQRVVADAETREIEDIFRQDPTLSYHLLRLVNSLGMGANRRITSFSQAILILGRQQLRRWLNLMLFASRADDHRAAMLLSRVAVRARSMELLAREAGLDRSDQELAFMAGMFSLLGVLFGLPLPEVFKPLQISEVLVAAVLHRHGPIGQLLQTVEGVERGDATGLQNLPGGLVLTPVQFSLLHLGAFQWMLGIVRETHGSAHA